MAADDEFEPVMEAALLALANGPLSLSDLTAVLLDIGALAEFEELPHGALMELLDELLLDTDDVWVSEDEIAALTSTLLDGAVFTHRLSASELERGVIDATPDLSALDLGVPDGLALPGAGIMERCYPFNGEPHLDDNGSFVFPAGFLKWYAPSELAGLRRVDSTVSLEVIAEPGPGEAEKTALQAAFKERYIEGYGTEPDDLVLDALCHDPSLFRSPVLPVGELLESIGLEQREGWFGPQGEGWDTPGAHHMESVFESLIESWGLDDCCQLEFGVVLLAWREHMSGDASFDRADLRLVAKALAHGSVGPAFAEFVLQNFVSGSEPLAAFAADIARAPGKLAAPAQFLQALEAERDGNAVAAEGLLRASILADPDYGPALEELAWYEADRGEAQKAVSLLRRSGRSDNDAELSYLASRLSSSAFTAARNDPCPCGSGRKFKSCCINGAQVTLEDRAGWLYHKAVIYSARPRRRGGIEDLFELANLDQDPDAGRHLLPILVDMAVFDLGGLESFIGERGALLPADELGLAQTWLGTPLVLWEVVDTDPGATLTLRDTRTGDRATVTERTASKVLKQGQLILARVVVAGAQRQIVGLPLEVQLRHRASLMELLDSDPEAEDIALWLAVAFAPPHLTNREGERMMLCSATLRAPSASWEQLSGLLDTRYGKREDNQWTETVEIDGETVVRCFLRRQRDDLMVETNSNERFDRVLTALLDEIDVDLVLVDEERLPPSEALNQTPNVWGDPESDDPFEMTDEMTAAMAEIMRAKETQWLDEQIPALSGLTPRQAADDPTRREDLVALLNEFDHYETASPGLMTFDVSRLRKELGILSDR
jgi:SEC-C motif